MRFLPSLRTCDVCPIWLVFMLRSAVNTRRGESMATGSVKWFNDDKGFGFITPDEGGKDLFVHHTGINSQGFRSLTEGTRVSYEAEAGDKGPKAVNVSPI